MLKFQTQRKRKPTLNLFGRKEQRRVLILVLMLGFVVLLMGEAAKPQNWMWLWGMQGQPVEAIEQADDGAPIDNRVARRIRDDEPDVFVAQAPREKPAAVVPRENLFQGIDAPLLDDVEDNMPWRAEEYGAFFNILNVCRDRTEEELQQAATPVSYVQLAKQSDEYRGDLVSVRGLVHRAFPIDAVPNDLGIEQYYQVWIQPDDRPEPVIIYCLELPEGFPTGMLEVKQRVVVNGFFFKRLLYMAARDMLSAPVLLARTVQWQPAAAGDELAQQELHLPMVVGVAAVIALAFIGLVIFRSRNVGPAEPLIPSSSARLSALAREEVGPSPEEHLRNLSQFPAENAAESHDDAEQPHDV